MYANFVTSEALPTVQVLTCVRKLYAEKKFWLRYSLSRSKVLDDTHSMIDDDMNYYLFLAKCMHYDEITHYPCLCCGELYPVGFSPFVCKSCELFAFEHDSLTDYSKCDNYFKCIGKGSWSDRFVFLQQKFDYYTKFTHSLQRVHLGIKYPSEEIMFDPDHSSTPLTIYTALAARYHGGVGAAFWDTRKIRHALFEDKYMAPLILPEINDGDEFVITKSNVLPQLNVMNNIWNRHYLWIFGTKEQNICEAIIESANFEYKLYDLQKQMVIPILIQHLNNIMDLVEQVYELLKPPRCMLKFDKNKELYICDALNGLYWCGKCACDKDFVVYRLQGANVHTCDHY